MGLFKTPEERYRIGLAAYQDKKFDKAISEVKKAAKAGYPDAEYLYAVMCDDGDTDLGGRYPDQAVKYMKIAAEKGYADAQYRYGRLCYEKASDLPPTAANPETAFQWFEKAANQGHAKAQHRCAAMYANGDGVPQDKAKACNWAKLAKDQNEEGAAVLFDTLARELALPVVDTAVKAYEAEDYQTAFPLFEKAAEMGGASAQYYCGSMYLRGQGTAADLSKAFHWIRCAAKQGHENAQVLCGAMCDAGEGTSVDKQQALAWYERAAKRGDARAALRCALAYYRGVDVSRNINKALAFAADAQKSEPEAQTLLERIRTENAGFVKAKEAYENKDYAAALSLFKEAADQGVEDAIYYCALMYEKGLGTEENLKKAMDLYLEASEKGYVEAQVRQGELFSLYSEHYTGEKARDALSLSLHWYLQAAKQGHIDAQIECGVCYLNGKGTDKDESAAFSWFEKAAEQGARAAQFNLGILYLNGAGTKKDEAKAFFWFERAAEQGLVKAQNECASLYDCGEGLSLYKKAFYWYMQSAKQGDPVGQRCCGRMYSRGLGVEKDKETAKMWFEKAAAQGDNAAKLALNAMR